MARYVYGLIFLIANLLAWAARDHGRRALNKVIKFKNCKEGENCLGQKEMNPQHVMFLSTLGTLKTHSSRDKWHSGWVFLLIQLISVISLISWLNEYYQSQKDAERCHVRVMLLATTSYTVCIVGVIFMYIWYAPDSSCLPNIFFITWTLFLIQLMTCIALHPKVNAGYLTPALIGLYVVFICWCAIQSEPVGENCNRKAAASNRTDCFVVALLAMAIATFSTGIDSQCFRFKKDVCSEGEEEDGVPYGYGLFHFVFATGAMYFAMQLIGLRLLRILTFFWFRWMTDVGWTSTWVRIVNEWVAVRVYIWMPIMLKCRRQRASGT
ncbi:hypothetical protein Bca52824_073265 [Brassica carinata]|uniref:Serinc-domain containing serine and sphingolipid biosynthesis protein n=1 Tax=Brassica carinata TaxID=52824 RepID=A0A8X7Q9J4_BRACI|nr:hypothetical protein Bca52824_073265 [Brassica carinata]